MSPATFWKKPMKVGQSSIANGVPIRKAAAATHNATPLCRTAPGHPTRIQCAATSHRTLRPARYFVEAANPTATPAVQSQRSLSALMYRTIAQAASKVNSAIRTSGCAMRDEKLQMDETARRATAERPTAV